MMIVANIIKAYEPIQPNLRANFIGFKPASSIATESQPPHVQSQSRDGLVVGFSAF